MNGHDRIVTDRLREERHRALANCEAHLNQIIAHLRYVEHYNLLHGFQLELPRETSILGAMNQCARINQLDKEKSA